MMDDKEIRQPVHFKFEELKVYQKGLDFFDTVCRITRPMVKREDAYLKDQFRRASLSICLNLAEGSGGTKAESARYWSISSRSLRECVALIEVLCRQGFIDSEMRLAMRSHCEELSRMIHALIRSLKTLGK